MSDQALVWKAGFGALVLLFCAATYLTRKHPEVAAPAPAFVQQTFEPAPPEVQDDAPPVRVQVTLHEPQPLPTVQTRIGSKVRGPVQTARPAKAPSPRIHNVVAKRKASPYAVGRKHYPYDPRERWAFRDAP